MGTQDFGIGEWRPRSKILFRVQPHADTRRHSPATTGALVGAGLRNFLHRQALDLAARAVTTDPGDARIDDVADAGYGQRGFGDVGRQHDARPATRLEHPVLLDGRQPGVQRQNLRVGRMVLAQTFRRFPDFPLAGKKDQNIAWPFFPHLVYCVQYRLLQIAVALVFVRGQQRPVAHLHGISPARDLDNGCLVEMAGKSFGIDGRRGNDQLEIGPARQQPLEIAQQEIDVQAALVGLVENDRFVLVQLPVALGFRQQNAIGHQFDPRIRPRPVGKTHLVTHLATDRRSQFCCDSRRHRAGGDPTRLGMADQPRRTQPERETDFR
jgi:hypothetical protein